MSDSSQEGAIVWRGPDIECEVDFAFIPREWACKILLTTVELI